MYKFFGEPLKIIKSKTSNQPLFRFDTKGEFITDDPEIINRAMGYFDYIPMKAEATGEKVEKTIHVPPMTIVTKGQEEIKESLKTDLKKHCKKCDFTCDNQGELLAHYREAHKKEG